jgi:hypothetical protein
VFPPELQKFLAQRRIPLRSFRVILGARHQDAEPRLWSDAASDQAAQKRDKFAGRDYSRDLRSTKWGFGSSCTAAIMKRARLLTDMALLICNVRFTPQKRTLIAAIAMSALGH